MAQHITSFVHHCNMCQCVKGRTSAPSGLLQPLPIPSFKFEEWTMGFNGPLLVCQGYTGLFVAVDKCSKLTRLIPCSFGQGDGGLTAPVVASLFFDHIVCHFGVPKSVLRDHDMHFMSHFWCAFWALMGTKVIFSSAYHPETDG